MKPGSITYPEVKQMSKSEKSEIEKLGEKLQKKIWRENKANLTKDGRRTMSVLKTGSNDIQSEDLLSCSFPE